MRGFGAAVLSGSLLVALVASGCGGPSETLRDDGSGPAAATEAGGAIDQRSYALGGIGAFSEMVGAGVKRLALSAPLDPAEMDALVKDAIRIAESNGAEIYRETDFLVTDLFPAELTEGKDVLLISSAATREEYLALKVAKERLVAAGEYEGEARLEISRRFGALLSYSEEKIRALLERVEDGG